MIDELPICNACGNEITDPRCIVMDAEDRFDTCFCLYCKSRMLRVLSPISSYATEIFRDILEEHERKTPTRMIDDIEGEEKAWRYQF